MQDDYLVELGKEGLLEEVARLNEVNRQLQSEMKLIKDQYDEAIKFTYKIEEFSEENKNLKKQISESKLKVDDLERRLQISQQLNAELSSTKDQIKVNFDKAHFDEISDLQMQINIAKNENLNLNSRFQQQIKETESSLFSAQSEIALSQKQMTKVLQIVGTYFNQIFKTPQDLIQAFTDLIKEKDSGNGNNNETLDINTKNMDALMSKISSLRAQYQNEKQKRKESQMTIIKLKKKMDQEISNYEEQITQLKDHISQQANEIERLELLQQQKLLKIEGPPPPRLRNKGIQLNLVDATDNSLVENYRHQLSNANKEAEAQEANISILKMQLDSMVKQVEEAENAKNTLNQKIKQIAQKYQESENDLKHQRQKNDNLIIKLNNLEEKLTEKQTQDSLPTSKLESQIKILQGDLHNKDLVINDLENALKIQKIEIAQNTSNKEKLIALLVKQNQMLNVFDELCQKKANPQIKYVEKIITTEPKFKWAIDKLPKEIFDIVKDISENDAISIESRIKNIFIVINKWITQNDNIHQKLLNKIQLDYEQSQFQFESFKKNLLEICEFEDTDNSSIFSQISNLVKNCRETAKELIEMKENELELLETTKCQTSKELIDKFKTLILNNSTLLEKLENERKKRSMIKKQFVVLYAEREKDFSQKIDLLNKSNENSRKQIEKLQQNINSLQKQNKSLIEQLQEVNKVQQKVIKENNEANQNKDEQHIEHNYEVDVEDMSRTQAIYHNEELQYQIKNLEKTSNIWKEAAQKATDETTKLQNTIKDMKDDFEKQIEQINKKHEIEIEQNNNTIREMSNKLKAQAEDSKMALDKLNESLIKVNKMYEGALQQISDLKYESEKVRLSAETKVESIERAKKLSEAQLKAKILSIDSSYAMTLEDEKQKSETEKRELIEYFVRSFKRFSNINSQMNEESFFELVRKVRSEFDKKQKTEDAIRKLIKAKDDDTIEDALTQFIIQNHPQFQEKSF